jgi:hypothetical protein
MATRVDPEQYSDTPIFRELLRSREGRWPGITEADSYEAVEELVTTLEEKVAPPPVMVQVVPLFSKENAIDPHIGEDRPDEDDTAVLEAVSAPEEPRDDEEAPESLESASEPEEASEPLGDFDPERTEALPVFAAED